MLDVKTPSTIHEWDQVRALMRAFVAWHRQRHHQDIQLVDSYFDAAAFDAELAALPGPYAPPKGRLLLACLDGRAVGCVALKDLGGGQCEMKRMFVHVDAQGRGVGRALATAIVNEARGAGYRTMLLDTSIRQMEAQALYRSLGFAPGDPDMSLPQPLRDWLVFMALDLSAAAAN
jgi:GNAT superfamily N-acetyltransferase